MTVLPAFIDRTRMPKEKILFFIGVWIIVLSHFVGLPTDVKNYLFIGTGALLVFVSYGYLGRSHGGEEPSVAAAKEEPRQRVAPESDIPSVAVRKTAPVRRRKPRVAIIKETPIEEAAPEETTPSPFTTYPSYEPPIRVRKARIRAKKPLAEVPAPSPYADLNEEDDVIVISSDGGDRPAGTSY